MSLNSYLFVIILSAIRSFSILWIGIKQGSISIEISSICHFAGLCLIALSFANDGWTMILLTCLIGVGLFAFSCFLNRGLSMQKGFWLKMEKHG
jgi:hypothetical protein